MEMNSPRIKRFFTVLYSHRITVSYTCISLLCLFVCYFVTSFMFAYMTIKLLLSIYKHISKSQPYNINPTPDLKGYIGIIINIYIRLKINPDMHII